MGFDINDVLGNMVSAVKNIAADDVPSMGEYAKTIIEKSKESFAELAQAFRDGDIDADELETEVAREQKVLEAEFLTLQVMSKAMVQKAVNAAVDIFINAVKVAI